MKFELGRPDSWQDDLREITGSLGDISPVGMDVDGDAEMKSADGKWVKTKFFMDSGAKDTVCPQEYSPAHALRRTRESREGRYYRAANGTQIKVHGRKSISGMTDDWKGLTMEAEVADVKKPLGSVHRICAAGNTVVFTEQGGYVQNNATNKKTEILHDGRGYYVNLWVPSFAGQGKP